MEVYTFAVPMALVDFIPVFLFGISAVLMQRDLYNKMSACAFACLAAGNIDASRDGASAALNRVELGVNCLGQALLGGVYALHRAGLREYRLL